MTRFHPSVPFAELEEDRLYHVEIAGRQVLLVRTEHRVHAAANACPHAGSPLSLGRLINGTVQCSLHGLRFSLSDGTAVGRTVCPPLEVYETRINEGRVEVALPEPGPIRPG